NTIRDGLNKIYQPYGVDWEVEVLAPFTDRSWDVDGTGLQSTGYNMFSQYTPEMKALNAAYGLSKGYDETLAYLFYFAEKPEEENNLLGDMPLASQVGYIFSKNINDAAIHTIAHELGHGVFHCAIHLVAEMKAL
ncbi:MAG: hypothetical protein HC819_22755, partial [Cyclobacteriaceae bacterium]|nr:hypothetical protein [Cyclobacteriaceae bacterium]